MPLYLKALDPTLDILGNEQVLRYNVDQVNNTANLLLMNAFTATAGIFPSTSISFTTSSFQGFRFYHEPYSGSFYGNFYLQKYSKFGTSTNILKYDEITNNLNFFNDISLPNANNFTVNGGGNINATTGMLKGNNLATHNANGIAVLNNLGMNNNYITLLPTPINNQDAANKQFVLDNTGGGVKSIVYGYMYFTQNTNLTFNDHVKFDSIAFGRGSNINLDTTSVYNNSLGVASLGRITLAAGKTYKLTAGSSTVNFSSTNGCYVGFRWYNSDSNAPLGTVCTWWSSSWNYTSGGIVIAYITTTTTARVELRINVNVGVGLIFGTSDSNSATWFTVEEV